MRTYSDELKSDAQGFLFANASWNGSGKIKHIRATSRLAYEKIRDDGTLSRRRKEVYDFLYRNGPSTGSMVSQRIPGGWKRLSELNRDGLIVEAGKDQCPVTGQTAIWWDIK